MKDPIVAEARKARRKLGLLMVEHPERFRALMKDIEKRFKDGGVPTRSRRNKKVTA